jgi:hypothetical protein
VLVLVAVSGVYTWRTLTPKYAPSSKAQQRCWQCAGSVLAVLLTAPLAVCWQCADSAASSAAGSATGSVLTAPLAVPLTRVSPAARYVATAALVYYLFAVRGERVRLKPEIHSVGSEVYFCAGFSSADEE